MSEHKEPDNNPEGIAFIDGFGGGAIGSDRSLSLEQRLAFLKLPIAERRRILESQAEKMLAHYQQDSQWQELMAGDIIDY